LSTICGQLAYNEQVLLQVGFYNVQLRNRCPIENMKLKLTTKSSIDIRLPEQKYSNANSRSFNLQPHLQQY
jgi:hypothetical protein